MTSSHNVLDGILSPRLPERAWGYFWKQLQSTSVSSIHKSAVVHANYDLKVNQVEV